MVFPFFLTILFHFAMGEVEWCYGDIRMYAVLVSDPEKTHKKNLNLFFSSSFLEVVHIFFRSHHLVWKLEFLQLLPNNKKSKRTTSIRYLYLHTDYIARVFFSTNNDIKIISSVWYP